MPGYAGDHHLCCPRSYAPPAHQAVFSISFLLPPSDPGRSIVGPVALWNEIFGGRHVTVQPESRTGWNVFGPARTTADAAPTQTFAGCDQPSSTQHAWLLTSTDFDASRVTLSPNHT